MTQPPKSSELLEMFNKFAGKIVDQKDPNDPVLAEMKKLAEDNGYGLHIWWPGVVWHRNQKQKWVHVGVNKAGNGKFCVHERFSVSGP